MKISIFIDATNKMTSTVKRLIKASSFIYIFENLITLAAMNRTVALYSNPTGSRIIDIFRGVLRTNKRSHSKRMVDMLFRQIKPAKKMIIANIIKIFGIR